MTNRVCMNCCFAWERFEQPNPNIIYYDCRRRAPSIGPPNPVNEGYKALFPTVAPLQWCGEFKNK
jgi:hypothetical protein